MYSVPKQQRRSLQYGQTVSKARSKPSKYTHVDTTPCTPRAAAPVTLGTDVLLVRISRYTAKKQNLPPHQVVQPASAQQCSQSLKKVCLTWYPNLSQEKEDFPKETKATLPSNHWCLYYSYSSVYTAIWLQPMSLLGSKCKCMILSRLVSASFY